MSEIGTLCGDPRYRVSFFSLVYERKSRVCILQHFSINFKFLNVAVARALAYCYNYNSLQTQI